MRRYLCVLLLTTGAQAWAFACPQNLATDPKAQLVHAWLDRFKGKFVLPGCQVEITACSLAEAGGASPVLGELYLVDATGREAYLPLTIVDEHNPKIETVLEASERRINYLKIDHFFEAEYGRTEAYRLEIRLDKNEEKISRIDLGTYATRKKLHQRNGNQSEWYNCGDSYR